MTDREFEEKYLKGYTPSQLEAVRAVEGPVLLLAVPGSGKTTVLVSRLGYMVCCRNIPPESILTMTYTVAATREMRQRFAALFGQELADRMEFRTINGLSSKIISYYEKNCGKERAFRLLESEGELNRAAAQAYCEVTGERYAPPGTVKDIRTGITYVKNMMLSGDEVGSVQVGVEDFPGIYARYCAYLKSQRLMDYDDQMTYALLFLEKVPSVLEHFRNTFKYICVDEAQDTSKIQHEIIRLLASRSENLFMVGDEDQSIYGFRAAYPDALMSFEEDHPGGKVLLIEENFRSTPEIVALANAFAARNRFRREKTIRPTRESGGSVRKILALDREAQYDYLLRKAREEGPGTAILYRNNDSALVLIDLFERDVVRYSCRNFDAAFFTHRVINDIRAFVRFAQNPRDPEPFMQIYYKMGLPISKSAAQYACDASGRTGKDILTQLLGAPSLPPAARERAAALPGAFAELLRADARSALRIILSELQYMAYVEQNNLDTNKFFVLRMLARNEGSITSLLSRLDELQSIIQSPKSPEGGALTISTIHSAKGLEFDRVFLLDIIDGILPAKTAAECKRESGIRNYEEDRRLFYVAMTRAKSSLYLFSCADSSSEFISEALAALPTEAYSVTDVFAFLRDDLLGRTYTKKEKGQGEILAQCEDRFLIKYLSGGTELLSLAQMAEDRDRTAKYVQARPSGKKKASSAGRAEKSSAGVRAEPLRSFRAGSRVIHTSFGPGRVVEVSGSGEGAVITVAFDEKYGERRLVLRESVRKGILTLSSGK